MNTRIGKVALLAGVLFASMSFLQVTAETVGDIAPSEITQCVDLKNNLIITSRDRNTNGEVTLLQEFLQEAGFLIPDPTGYFGGQTKAAVMKFQKSVNLIDSGYVGAYTRAAIKKASCGGTTSGGSSGGAIACTMEARLCSDGSMMPRDANCTWLPNKCPATPTQTTNTCNYYENGSVAAVFGGTAQCTKAIVGQSAPGLPNAICKCPSSAGEQATTNPVPKTSLARITVSNSLSGPWLESGSSVCNSGKIYIQATSVMKPSNPKGCMAPAGSTCTPRAFYSDEWVGNSAIRATISGGDYPNGTYDSYLSYPGEALAKIGGVTLKSCSSSATPSPTGKVCAYEGAVFGGSPPCTEAIEGKDYGSKCVCKTSTTGTSPTSTTNAQVKLTVSNSPSGPWVKDGTVINAGTIYSQTTGLVKSRNPKGCASPAGDTGCLSPSAHRDFTEAEWGGTTHTVTTSVQGGIFPNQSYDTYIMYPGETPVKVGTFTIKASQTEYGWSCVVPGPVNVNTSPHSCSAANINEKKNIDGYDCYCQAKYSAATEINRIADTDNKSQLSSFALTLLENISKSLLNGFAFVGGLTSASGGQGSVLGASTSRKECVSLTKNLHRGDESYQTTMLQNFLVEKGFLSEKASGFFGDLTIAAVKKYQSSIGIPETGMVYDLTRQAIQDETCNY